MSCPGDIAAIILAAGMSQRFGSDADQSKILAPLAGRPLIRHVGEAAAASQARPLIAVLGPAADKVAAALAGLDANCLTNQDPAAGLSHSLTLGLAAVPEHCAGAIILLADMPRITAAIIDRLIEAFRAAPEPPRAVIPVHAGRRGNPVLLGRTIFTEAKAIAGDRGARALLDGQTQGISLCPIDDSAIEIDIDTKESLDALARQMRLH
jgi:molybdenum cofactor cytidylyltransferase